MLKRIALSSIICFSFIITGLTHATVNDSIIQVFSGRDARFAPDTMDGPLLVKKFSKWVYVITADWSAPGSPQQIMQFEISGDTLKYVKRTALIAGQAEYFVVQGKILTLPSGDGMMFMYNPTPYHNSVIRRITIDKTTGDATELTPTNIYPTYVGAWTVSPDFKFIYVFAFDTVTPIQVFSVDATTGDLSAVPSTTLSPHIFSGNPRISSDGKFLYCGSMDSFGSNGNGGSNYYIEIYSRNVTTGQITHAGHTIVPAGTSTGFCFTPGDRKLMSYDGVHYNRNSTDGSLSVDTIVPIPFLCSVTGIVFPDSQTGYIYSDNHCAGGLQKFDWNQSRDIISSDVKTIYRRDHYEGIIDVDFDSATGVLYGAAFYHSTDTSQIIVVKRKGLPTSAIAKPAEPVTLASGLDANPDPFNPSTLLTYSLAGPVAVTIDVFDLSGKRVLRLVSGRQSAGAHRVSFNATGLSSGLYVCKLTAGNRVSTRRVLLVR